MYPLFRFPRKTRVRHKSRELKRSVLKVNFAKTFSMFWQTRRRAESVLICELACFYTALTVKSDDRDLTTLQDANLATRHVLNGICFISIHCPCHRNISVDINYYFGLRAGELWRICEAIVLRSR